MMEKVQRLTVEIVSDDVEVIIACLDTMRESLADYSGKTDGYFNGEADGRWKLREEERCEHCHGAGEVATDEDDGEGHIMRGVGTEPCICTVDDAEDDYEKEVEE